MEKSKKSYTGDLVAFAGGSILPSMKEGPLLAFGNIAREGDAKGVYSLRIAIFKQSLPKPKEDGSTGRPYNPIAFTVGETEARGWLDVATGKTGSGNDILYKGFADLPAEITGKAQTQRYGISVSKLPEGKMYVYMYEQPPAGQQTDAGQVQPAAEAPALDRNRKHEPAFPDCAEPLLD